LGAGQGLGLCQIGVGLALSSPRALGIHQ
jgi:hypothetical protein